MGVPSPCISICTLDDETNRCRGCLRTRDEIAAWPVMDDVQKRAVLEQLRQRRKAGASADFTDYKGFVPYNK